ncbi:hypothetical protein [Streptomyces durhamensis]|uniref:hypothetical protein n=1 Tax=Streptomyces durhamensis TaxID=68194 RepID=UPI000B191C60|nr:hypothetical protein [Streptomyces durhamensis]
MKHNPAPSTALRRVCGRPVMSPPLAVWTRSKAAHPATAFASVAAVGAVVHLLAIRHREGPDLASMTAA